MKEIFANIKKVFKVSNYRYYFVGQGLSLVGTWAHSTAMGWLIYRLTNSSALLGVMGFLNFLPALLISYPAGVIADRINLKKGMYITQSFMMLFAFTIAFMTLTGTVKIWHILLIGFLIGITGAFDMPFRQTFIVSIVEKKILHNAIALNSLMFNLSRIIGPLIAGYIIGFTKNEGWCFLFNAVSFVAVMMALYFINPLRNTDNKIITTGLESFKEGLKYVKNTEYIKYPIMFMFFMSFILLPVVTLMPVYVKLIGGDAKFYGMMMSSVGVGAAISGLHIAGKSRAKAYVNMVNIFSSLYGLSLIILSLINFKYFAILIMFFVGFCVSRQFVGSNTIIQTLVDDRYRGRVMSLYTLSFSGLSPFGNLFWGYITHISSIRVTLFLCGLWVLGINLWYHYRMKGVKKKVKIEYSEGEFEVL